MTDGTDNVSMSLRLEDREAPIDVTVVLPAYNEDGNIERGILEIARTMDHTGLDYEFIIVDDGSTDGTWDDVRRISAANTRVHALKHRRNAGKASALANGFAFARGNVVAICDADLQYDPEDVLRVVDKVYEGYDAVSANKTVRPDSLERRLPSKFFNFFLRRTTGVQLHDMNAGLKAFRRDAAQELIPYGYGELHRYFMVILALKGYSVTEIPVQGRPRTDGTSKYGLERYVRGALDFMTIIFLSGYLERPLHLFGGIGILLSFIGTVILAWSVAAALWLGEAVSGSSLQMASLLILAGVQLFAIGLFAEMINKLQHGSKPKVPVSAVIGVERRRGGQLLPPALERRAPRSLATLEECGVGWAEESARTRAADAADDAATPA